MSRSTLTSGHPMPRLAAIATVAAVISAAPLAAVADDAPLEQSVIPAPDAVVEETAPAVVPAPEAAPAAEASAAETPVVEDAPAVEDASVPQELSGAEVAAPASADVPLADEGAPSAKGDAPVQSLADEPQELGPNQAPVAVDDFYVVSQDTTLVVSFPGIKDNDYDPDGDWFQLPGRTDPTHGTLTASDAHGSFTYVPDAGFVGIDTYEYWASDSSGAVSETATVTIEVKAAGIPVDVPPIAVDDVYYYDVNTPLYIAPGILANDELHGDAGEVTIDYLPGNWGTATIDLNPDGSFLYTPAPDQSGSFWFRYRVCTVGGCSVAEVTLEHWEDKEPSGPPAPPAPANHAPVANPDTAYASAGWVATVAAPGVLANDTDADGDALEVTWVGAPAHGIVSSWSPDGTVQYLPDAGYHGAVEIEYHVSDGLSESTGILTVIVSDPTNHAPVGTQDVLELEMGDTAHLDAPGILANDSDQDGDALYVSVHTAAYHGNMTIAADGSLTYTPAPGFTGFDFVQYMVSDGDDKALSAVLIYVLPGDEPGNGGGGDAGSGDPSDPIVPSEPTSGSNGSPRPASSGAAATVLAQTGAESTGGLLAAALALTAGAALISIRRRTQRR